MQQKLQKDPADPSSNPASLAQAAILAALASRWQEAISINERIIRRQKDDVEAINRLARAYWLLGNTSKAQKYYKKVLELDPYNVIALKNLEKLVKTAKSNGSPRGEAGSSRASEHFITNGEANINLSQIFLYEPGKTKLVSLLNLAPPATLVTLSCAQEVFLNPKNHAITVHSADSLYLGAFPDDLAHRLLALIARGYKYQAYVKSVSVKMLSIFIRELERSSKLATQPSFANKNGSFFDDET